MRFFLTLIIFLISHNVSAYACPKISKEKFDDINCDRRFKLMFTGDSIVRGVGDERYNDEGGYPLRIDQKFDRIIVTNIGVPGDTSAELLRDFRQNLNKKGSGITKQRSKNADAVVIAVGVNDYWDKIPLSFTVRNIRRLVKFLKKKLKLKKTSPEVFVSTLLPVAPVNSVREKQKEFVQNLNQELLRQSSSKLPVLLRLENINDSVMGEDGLHPDSPGYDLIANKVADFVRNTLKPTLRRVHRDRDRDGVYDFMEKNFFGTSISSKDTDGDRVSDRREIFRRKSNPLDPLSK